MYEVFFNDRKITIARDVKPAFVKERVRFGQSDTNENVKEWFSNFAETDTSEIVITHSSPHKFWKELFVPAFEFIRAAGGVVVRNNKILFIFRNGKWDLPKGKTDVGETANDAAIREVAEECGIKGHHIVKSLPSTYHIYLSPYKNLPGIWILKETLWFEMEYHGEVDGTPETDENITQIRWFEKNALGEVLENTYESLKPVILRYKC